MNLNTTGTIGLIVSLVIVAIFWAPMIKASLGNVWKYVNDKPFEHETRFPNFKRSGSHLRLGDVIEDCVAIGSVSLSFVLFATLLSHIFPIFIGGILLSVGLVVAAFNIPRAFRFLMRTKNAIGKIGEAAHKHRSDGSVADVDPGNTDY